jgi:DNA invertase Pin-like site-specific DNA recombinase
MKNILLSKEEFIEIIDERLEKQNLIIQNKKEESDEIELLTRHEIARIFGVSLVTVNDWANKEIIKRHHMGSRVYFFRSEVFEALAGSKYGKRK